MVKNSLFNSAQYFDSKGLSLANHRKKMLPPTADESKIFKPGSKSSIIMVNGIKSAIVICYELEFPEIIRKLALQGVELIIAPTGQSSHWPAAALYNCRTRAFENGIYVIYANSTGNLNGINFMGESKIIGPDGLDVVNAGQLKKSSRERSTPLKYHQCEINSPTLMTQKRSISSLYIAVWNAKAILIISNFIVVIGLNFPRSDARIFIDLVV